jgi:hypothetical protein
MNDECQIVSIKVEEPIPGSLSVKEVSIACMETFASGMYDF